MDQAKFFTGSVQALQKIINDRKFDVVGEFGQEGKQKIGEREVYVSYIIEIKDNVAYIRKNIYSSSQVEGRRNRQISHNSSNNNG
jgi:hypothetical protein